MNIQDQLAAFDGWLTSKIEEAHASRKDLAFRDLAPVAGAASTAWEYSLLTPGQSAPVGEGWSVYRLQGVWPEFLKANAAPEQPEPGERKTVFAGLAEAVFGQEPSPVR